MSDKTESYQAARTLVAGAFGDFLIHLTSLPDPIIVGNQYPRQKLLEAFNDWANLRNFSTQGANLSLWRTACNDGVFKGEKNV